MIDFEKLENAAFENNDTEILDLFEAGATDSQIMDYIKENGLPITYDEIKKEKSVPKDFNEQQAKAYQLQNEEDISEKQLEDYIVETKNKKTVENAKRNAAEQNIRKKDLESVQSLADAWRNSGIYDSPYFKDMNTPKRILTALGFKLLSPKMADDYYIKTGNIDGELAVRAGIGAALNAAEWSPQASGPKYAATAANTIRLAANPTARSAQENIIDSEENRWGNAAKDAILNTGLNTVIDKPKETLAYMKNIAGGILPKAAENTLKGVEEIIGADAKNALRQEWMKKLNLDNDFSSYEVRLSKFIDSHTPEEVYYTAKQLSEDGFNKTAEDLWTLMSKNPNIYAGHSADAVPFRQNRMPKMLETSEGSLVRPSKEQTETAARQYEQKLKDFPNMEDELYNEAEKAKLVERYRRIKAVDDYYNKPMMQRFLAGLVDSRKIKSTPTRAGVREIFKSKNDADFEVAGYLQDRDLIRMWEAGFVPSSNDTAMNKAYEIWRKETHK